MSPRPSRSSRRNLRRGISRSVRRSPAIIIFRGVTQSNHQPSVAAYFEPRYNINKDHQLYVGIGGASIDFPNRAAAEVDFYAGYRPTFGKFAFDFGVWYYWYPGGQCFSAIANVNTVDCSPSGGVVLRPFRTAMPSRRT